MLPQNNPSLPSQSPTSPEGLQSPREKERKERYDLGLSNRRLKVGSLIIIMKKTTKGIKAKNMKKATQDATETPDRNFS